MAGPGGRLSVCLGGRLAGWRAGTMYSLSTGNSQDVNKRKGSVEGAEGRCGSGEGRGVAGREGRAWRWRMGNVRVKGWMSEAKQGEEGRRRGVYICVRISRQGEGMGGRKGEGRELGK